MKRTPSLNLLAPPSTIRRGDPTDVEMSENSSAPGSLLVPVGSMPAHLVAIDEATVPESPWAYGSQPGVDVWCPPANCRTHDGSAPAALKKCNFCHRNLEHYDVFMYRGDKAFCSLECRHHQIVMDDRQAMFKLTGKRYSMVPMVAMPMPSEAAPFWAPNSQAGTAAAANMHTFA